jgi:multiple sugar transport system ATP-binding protein
VAEVVFDEVTKVYDDGTKAVDSLDLDVADGEFMVLVGPSGCGKTTALRMVAGSRRSRRACPHRRPRRQLRPVARPRHRDGVPELRALPAPLVYDNIAFGLKVKKVPKRRSTARARRRRILGLEPFLKRKPRALSGGQRPARRDGRAIVRQPQAFLMDEPLSNLDAKLRVQMRAEIAGSSATSDVTTIYVTHDQVEAMTMGDRVAVHAQGRASAGRRPADALRPPVNLFVGGFIGSPAMNMIEATLERRNGGWREGRRTGDPHHQRGGRPAARARAVHRPGGRARDPARGSRGRGARSRTAARGCGARRS